MATVTEGDRLFSGGGGQRLDTVTFEISDLDKVHRDIIILGDPGDRRNRVNVIRTTPSLDKDDARNTYAIAVADEGARDAGKALDAILDQLQTMNMYLESMSE